MSRRPLNIEQFIQRAEQVHGSKYDYSLVNYINNSTDVTIICPIHGEFKQRPNNHFNGKGCSMCNSDTLRKTTSQFIKESIQVHGDKYDYSLVDYKGANKKVIIICPIHSEFQQPPYDHISGANCPKCYGNVRLTLGEFISKAKQVHGDKYDYSMVDYVNNSTKIKINCLKHGEFKQYPTNHLDKKHNCPDCAGNRKLTLDKFIKRSNKIHNMKYDYSLVEYKNVDTNVIILCPIHDDFVQLPQHHLNGVGCPYCRESKGEIKINKILTDNNIRFERQKRFKDCIYIRTLFFDFYLLDYNICIEFDGKQHFESVERFGGVVEFEKNKKRDKIKTDYCKDNNIQLIRIKYDESIEEKLNNIW